MAIREGRWDCPGCGSTGIFGREVDCPSCGKSRPGGVRFYLTDDAPVLRDPERLDEARAGADWVCEHCGGSNRARRRECEGCGAPRGTSPTQPVVEHRDGWVPGSEPKPLAGVASGARKGAGGCCGCGCLGMILLNLIGVIAAYFNPPVGGEDLVPAVVAAKSWVRTVVLEERKVVEGEGWELPDSARLTRSERRIRSYDQVLERYETVTREVTRDEQVRDGTETRTRQVSERVRTGTRTYVCGQRDMGNGYFEDIECEEPVYETRTRTESYDEPRYRTETRRETVTENEPVYRRVPVRATHYTYRVPRWVPSRTLKEQGDTTEPVWPEFRLARREREAERRQHYEIVVRAGDGEKRLLLLPHGRWSRYRIGDRVALRLGPELEVLPADSLSRCRRWHMGKGGAPPDSLGCSPPPPEPAPG